MKVKPDISPAQTSGHLSDCLSNIGRVVPDLLYTLLRQQGGLRLRPAEAGDDVTEGCEGGALVSARDILHSTGGV